MAKTSVVLCAGAWHTQAHIDPVVPFFEKAGYRVVPHTLLVSGAQTKNFEDDVKSTQSAIEADLQAGYNVVPIFHSLAGPSGLEAINNIASKAQDYSGKLLRIIMAASFVDVDPITQNMVSCGFLRPGEEEGILFANKAEEAFYNDISPEKAQPFMDALTTIDTYSSKPEPSSNRWQKAAPTTYLLCTQDTTVTPEIAEKQATEHSMEIVRMDAGHCPFTSQPEKFFEVVDGILRG